jgi:RNA ligase
MSPLVKYPRTPHLPWSPGAINDDTYIDSRNLFNNPKYEIVVTEKMDGENTSIYHDHIHARSMDSQPHPSQNWVRNFASTFQHKLDDGIRICGENVYATHAIKYEKLETYFYGISVWYGDRCFSWDGAVEVFNELGITPVPVIDRFYGSLDELEERQKTYDLEGKEGYVARIAGTFYKDEFDVAVAKYVRKNHVTADKHWRTNWDSRKINLLTKKG